MKITICFLFLVITPNLLLGQSISTLKRHFLFAVRHSEANYIGPKAEKNHQNKWYADSSSFATADTIAFYNFYNSPIQKLSCSKATWDFYDTRYLSCETEQVCREPSTGTTHPDGSTFYTVSLLKQNNQLLLKLVNKFNEESYRILSVTQLKRGDKRFGDSKILLARLKK